MRENRGLAITVAVLAVVAAAVWVFALFGGSDDSRVDPGCERWQELVIEAQAGSGDRLAAEAATEVATLTKIRGVRDAATSLARSLRDGSDIDADVLTLSLLCPTDL